MATSVTINSITYNGCLHDYDNNEYYCKTSSGTVITTDADLISNWDTAVRQIKITINGSYTGGMYWYEDSSGSGQVSIGSEYYKDAWVAYYRPGAKYPFALCSSKYNKDQFDLGWVSEDFLAYFAPQGKIESTVTFNPNGGTIADSEKTKKVKSTEKYGTLPTPATRKGFKFKGWFTSSSGGNQVTADTIVTKTENHTLYAQWTELHITINYYANGADSATFQGSSKDVSKVLLSHEIKYTEKADLYNYNNENQLNVIKYKHIARSGAQWNTSPDGHGSGTGISQGTEKTGQEWGVFFGKSIDSENKSQNIYVDWVPYGVVRIYVKGKGWKLGVPYVYSKSKNDWKETFPYIYDSKFGDTDGWKSGQ